MALNSSSVDIVGIFDSSTFRQQFVNSRPMRAEVQETSKVMQHPVETGVILSDHHVINPIRINIQLIINSLFYTTDYQEMRTAFINATNLNVHTKTGVYQNMIIADMPHQESPDAYDSIVMHLNLQEVIFAIPISVANPNHSYAYTPANPLYANTVQSGQSTSTNVFNTTPAQRDSINSYLKQ